MRNPRSIAGSAFARNGSKPKPVASLDALGCREIKAPTSLFNDERSRIVIVRDGARSAAACNDRRGQWL